MRPVPVAASPPVDSLVNVGPGSTNEDPAVPGRRRRV